MSSDLAPTRKAVVDSGLRVACLVALLIGNLIVLFPFCFPSAHARSLRDLRAAIVAQQPDVKAKIGKHLAALPDDTAVGSGTPCESAARFMMQLRRARLPKLEADRTTLQTPVDILVPSGSAPDPFGTFTASAPRKIPSRQSPCRANKSHVINTQTQPDIAAVQGRPGGYFVLPEPQIGKRFLRMSHLWTSPS